MEEIKTTIEECNSEYPGVYVHFDGGSSSVVIYKIPDSDVKKDRKSQVKKHS